MMKKILLVSSLFLAAFFVSRPVLAQNSDQKQKDIVLPKNQTVNQDYFAAGNTVTLSGIVNGDAYIAGGNILVDGTVNGDLLAAGGQINITGRVAGNARLIGGQIHYSGTVGRNITVVGGNITLAENTKLGGNLVAASSSLMALSPVTGNIVAAVGTLTLNNSVAGNVDAAVGTLILNSKSRIAKNLNYWSDSPAKIQEGAKILGQTQQKPALYFARDIKTPSFKGVTDRLARMNPYFRLISFVSSLLVGFIFLSLWPKLTNDISQTIRTRFGTSLALGFLILITSPLLFLFLLITVLGIPIAFLYLLVLIIASYLAPLFVSLLIGQIILRKKDQSSFLGLLIGLAIYELLLFTLPFVGWTIKLVVLTTGLGAIFLSLKNPSLSKT